MDYVDLAELLGVYVDRDSYTYVNAFRKYMDTGAGINNSKQLAYREYIIEDVRSLRDQIKELRDRVNRIEYKSDKE